MIDRPPWLGRFDCSETTTFLSSAATPLKDVLPTWLLYRWIFECVYPLRALISWGFHSSSRSEVPAFRSVVGQLESLTQPRGIGVRCHPRDFLVGGNRWVEEPNPSELKAVKKTGTKEETSGTRFFRIESPEPVFKMQKQNNKFWFPVECLDVFPLVHFAWMLGLSLFAN